MFDYLINFINTNVLFFIILNIGLCGIILNYNNIILTMISIELCLLSVNLNFIFYSLLINDIIGIIFSLIVLTVAAAEAAIGLAILVLFYRTRGNILMNYTTYLRG